ncbi:9149_t:CDS:1, partial [Funneliformis geosporum]
YLADGTKLSPVIIFKLKKIPCEEFPEGVVIRANSEGWMNEEEMIWWIENIWSLLVLDSFSAHKTEVVKKQL